MVASSWKMSQKHLWSSQPHTLKVASSILARCIDAAAGHHGICEDHRIRGFGPKKLKAQAGRTKTLFLKFGGGACGMGILNPKTTQSWGFAWEPAFFLASPEASNATLVWELIEALDKLPMRTSTPLFFPAKSQIDYRANCLHLCFTSLARWTGLWLSQCFLKICALRCRIEKKLPQGMRLSF